MPIERFAMALPDHITDSESTDTNPSCREERNFCADHAIRQLTNFLKDKPMDNHSLVMRDDSEEPCSRNMTQAPDVGMEIPRQ